MLASVREMPDFRETMLRVVTANLLGERLAADVFARLIASLDPDIVAVQELGYAAAERLVGLLPHGLLIPDDGAEGIGIALRAPGSIVQLPLPFRLGLVAHLDDSAWPKPVTPLEIINIHIANPIMWPAWRALWYRRGQLKALEDHLAQPARRVVVGDFNSSPAWPIYRRVRGRLRDAAVEVAERQGRKPARTWGPTSWSPRLLRIDYAFVDGIQPVDVKVTSLPGSDHSALVVDLAVMEG